MSKEPENMDELCLEVPVDDQTVLLETNDETALGEPTIWIYLSDNTSLEITHEEDGLPAEKQYFSIRRHCSEEDFENNEYHGTCGIIEQTATESSDKMELTRLLSSYLTQLKENGILIQDADIKQ